MWDKQMDSQVTDLESRITDLEARLETALGILALSRILFGGFGLHGGRGMRHRMMHKGIEHMTPEERERFEQGLSSTTSESTAQ